MIGSKIDVFTENLGRRSPVFPLEPIVVDYWAMVDRRTRIVWFAYVARKIRYNLHTTKDVWTFWG